MGNLRFDFTGRTVLVTGAARGIGREVSSFFHEGGAATYMVDLDEEELTLATAQIGARPLVADVSQTSSVEAAVAAAFDESGRIDVLVNNAGVLRDAWLWKLSDADWETVLAVHAGGTFKMTRACVPCFRSQGYGRVVNITSYTGLHGNTGQANYATAKAGIIGFTKTAAKELGSFGVTVNAISPNAETRMIGSLPESKRAQFLGAIAAGRIAEPREMCAAVGFLASEEAGYVTGVVLPVDGGHSM